MLNEGMTEGQGKVMVSACLLGERVRYDGGANPVEHRFLGELERRGLLVRFCPETAGGLAVPRPAAEIRGGTGRDVLRGRARVIDVAGNDVTESFVAGAKLALEAATREGVVLAILKDRSPSCASRHLYDGSFSRTLNAGFGVTAALLGSRGVPTFPENEIAAAEALWRRLPTF